jgi:NADH dehydrogenase FAD-containing subunit
MTATEGPLPANTRNLFGMKSGTAVPMPGLAQPAIQEGEYVAKVIGRRASGQPAPDPFWYWDKGDLAVVGRTFAVATLGSGNLPASRRGWCGPASTSIY